MLIWLCIAEEQVSGFDVKRKYESFMHAYALHKACLTYFYLCGYIYILHFCCCSLNKHINIPERNCLSGIKTVLESVRSYISDNYCFLVICMQT